MIVIFVDFTWWNIDSIKTQKVFDIKWQLFKGENVDIFGDVIMFVDEVV